MCGGLSLHFGREFSEELANNHVRGGLNYAATNASEHSTDIGITVVDNFGFVLTYCLELHRADATELTLRPFAFDMHGKALGASVVRDFDLAVVLALNHGNTNGHGGEIFVGAHFFQLFAARQRAFQRFGIEHGIVYGFTAGGYCLVATEFHVSVLLVYIVYRDERSHSITCIVPVLPGLSPIDDTNEMFWILCTRLIYSQSTRVMDNGDHGALDLPTYMIGDTNVDTKHDVFFELAAKVSDGTISRRAAIQRGTAVGLGTASLMALGAMPIAQAQDGEPKRGGTLRVGLQADPADLDPHKNSLTAALHVFEHVYSSLLATNTSLEPVPSVAESWEISEDGLTYTFHLRENVTFHNGRQLVAEDVKYSLERIVDPETASPRATDLAGVVTTEIPDDFTVVFTLDAADSSFLSKMMGSILPIVPKEVVDEHGDLLSVMVGTGPFKFVEYIPNSSVTLEAHEDYFEEGLPYLDGIEFQIVPDNTARTTALSSGTVDFIEYAPAQDLSIFESDETIMIAGDENTNIRYAAINTQREPFTDPKVREAIAKAIDRGPIVNAAIFGAGTPTNILFPESYWAGYQSEIPSPDIEGAKALLAEAGYPDGFTTELHSWSEYAFLSNAAIVMQEQLKQIGVESELRFEENATYLENYYSSNFDISVTGWSGFVDPNDVVQGHFSTDGSTNAAQYSDAEMDSLIAEGMAEIDLEARAEIYFEIQELIKKDNPWINLFIANQYEAMKTFVMGYEHIPTGSNISLKKVWLDQ